MRLDETTENQSVDGEEVQGLTKLWEKSSTKNLGQDGVQPRK